MNDIDRNPALARSAMLALVSGLHVSRALFVAARLQLADHLAHGPKGCAELAAATGTDAFALLRILRLLAAAGVLALDEADRASLTPIGETLRSDHPQSLRGWVIGQVGDYPYRAWGDVMHSVRTGGIAFDHAFGTDAWSYRAAHPDAARDFDDAMVSYVAASNASVIATGVFAKAGRIVDVGGGEGALLLAILAAHPAAVGTVFEQAHVARKAEARIAASPCASRCTVLEGDAFEGVPGGADMYLLSRVIHDWDDARAAALLGNCRRAMAPGARLVLVERILPRRIEARVDDQLVAASDLQMMVMNGGRERTEPEYRALLEATGFRFVRRVPTGSVTEVLEGEAW
jgi:SAM-dependent methyltransferase